MKVLFAISISIVLLMGCAARKYVSDDRQAGMFEPIHLKPGCILVKIDTVYNPLGGIVKNLHIKCPVEEKK
jgi:hypothetical protein